MKTIKTGVLLAAMSGFAVKLFDPGTERACMRRQYIRGIRFSLLGLILAA